MKLVSLIHATPTPFALEVMISRPGRTIERIKSYLHHRNLYGGDAYVESMAVLDTLWFNLQHERSAHAEMSA